MRRSGGTATKFGGIDTQLCVQEWRRRDPAKTAACVAERYGAPIRTVENWLSGASAPSGHWRAVIFEAEDPLFLVRVMPTPPAYIVDAARQAEARLREEERADLVRRIEALDASLHEAAR